MPNVVTIDGNEFPVPDAASASRLLLVVRGCIQDAREGGTPTPMISLHGTTREGDPIHTVVVVTPSTSVSAVFDRDPDSPISQAWKENLADLHAKHQARMEREMAEEGITREDLNPS